MEIIEKAKTMEVVRKLDYRPDLRIVSPWLDQLSSMIWKLDREWMYSETWFHEDGFEEKSLADIKAYIHETREHGLILGDKYITHDLVPSFYLAD